jgi:hypothetical protein
MKKETGKRMDYRMEDRARRSLCMKERGRQEERLRVSKKYETKTKGRKRSIDKEASMEFENHVKSTRKTVYTRPVVHVPVHVKKANENESR